MASQKLKLSVSDKFDNKEYIDKKYFSIGFENAELTMKEIAEVIDLGCAISYQYIDGKRKTENFICTDFLAVDIDHGIKIQDMEKNSIFKKYCSMIYVTPSHTPDEHRYRLFFKLPRTITKVAEVKLASYSLTKRLSGDLVATDGARIFYGSRGSNPKIYNRGITIEFLEELIQDGKVQKASESIAFDGSTTSRSAFELNLDRVVKRHDGKQITLESIKDYKKNTVPIYCPFHNDKSPSAFVSVSGRGTMFIYCASCKSTWYVKGTLPYDKQFNDFTQVVHQIKNREFEECYDDSPLKELIGPAKIKPKNIVISKDMHIEIKGIDMGLTLIKSPKGTGKTTFLSDALGRVIRRFSTLEEYEENTDPEIMEPLYGEDRILLIGHRQALIGDLCKRLYLNSYLDDQKNSSSEVSRRKVRYGVCLDSLHKVQNEKYNIIVIDEVEQVISHFLSDTIGEKRQGLFEIFCRLIQEADKVVALDADLGWITYVTLAYLTRINTGINQIKPLKKITIYVNEWQPKDRKLFLYNSMYQVIHEIKQNVIDGKRIFITSNSKEKVKDITNLIKSIALETKKPINLISITSENSGTSEIQEFIKNIKKKIIDYDVILSSPSLGTGIDISFENGKKEIDAVFGIFENQINTHFEIDQQIDRVRNPGSIHVWVSPRNFNFETDFRVAAHDFLHRNLQDTVTQNTLKNNWDLQSENVSPFLRMAALIVSHQRSSKNRLRTNFIQYRKQQGWDITFVKEDPFIKKEGKDLYDIGKEISDKEWKDAILNASIMEYAEYRRFSNELNESSKSFEPDQWFSFYKTRLELFYGEQTDVQLLTNDKKGAKRRAINLYEGLTDLNDKKYHMLYAHLSSSEDRNNKFLKFKIIRDRLLVIGLLYEILSTTPVFRNGKFDPNVRFTSNDLQKFVRISNQLRGFVLSQLDINTQSDLQAKPTMHLGKILEKVGLATVKVDRTTINKHKTNVYSLDKDLLQHIQKIVTRRKIPTEVGWGFVNRKYGFQENAHDQEFEDSDSYL